MVLLLLRTKGVLKIVVRVRLFKAHTLLLQQPASHTTSHQRCATLISHTIRYCPLISIVALAVNSEALLSQCKSTVEMLKATHLVWSTLRSYFKLTEEQSTKRRQCDLLVIFTHMDVVNLSCVGHFDLIDHMVRWLQTPLLESEHFE